MMIEHIYHFSNMSVLVAESGYLTVNTVFG